MEGGLLGVKYLRNKIVCYCSPSLSSRTHQTLITTRLPQKQLLGRHPMPSIIANINHDLINLLPAMAKIKVVASR